MVSNYPIPIYGKNIPQAKELQRKLCTSKKCQASTFEKWWIWSSHVFFFLSFVVVGIFIFKMNNRRDKNADHVQSFLPHLSTHTQFNTRYKKLYAVAWMWAISFEFDVSVDHVTNIVHNETHRDQMLTSHTQDSMKLNAILVMNWNWRETFCRRQKIATSH